MGIWTFFNLDFCQGKYGVGIHRANILEAIDRFGSISTAAIAVDLTFNQTWRTIRKLNSLCDKPFVGTRRGGRTGGAFLTPLGKDVLTRFREIERVINESTAPYIRELEKVVGVDKKPTVLPRYAQIIDPNTISASKKKPAKRRKRIHGARKAVKQKPPKSSRREHRR
ncbi:MAG: LysR family transcriptional regulator [Bradyrhizobium sp.]|uniref:winged helix-turn-helix domain-containing protein n=1 Tax=Bradyrhizobium sp. TaxID=376 RepID=UPI001C2981BC|nr:LysR family transcriptional regulator [Bradyrhizobium sp.]MBU6462319.1 LysR family transcriptional regulator [Pseudomonadota bacterium]MDE2067371.1 LysR family transcriptional regulator [Bradyrhizobium sp.]MDE2242753.1 LysR family transcriptional regulator [Bradyrhizobium sp.]